MGFAESQRENNWTRLQKFLSGVLFIGPLTIPASAGVGKVLTSDASGNASWGFSSPYTKNNLAQVTSFTDTLATSPGAGVYLVSVVLDVTTAATAGTVGATVTFTDDVGASTQTVFAGFSLTAAGRMQGIYVLRLASGSIDYTVTVAGVVGAPVFSVYANAIRLQ